MPPKWRISRVTGPHEVVRVDGGSPSLVGPAWSSSLTIPLTYSVNLIWLTSLSISSLISLYSPL